MRFIALFVADAQRLPLVRAKALALFQCEEGHDCRSWDPDAGANAAVLLPEAPPPPHPGQTEGSMGVAYSRRTETDVTELGQSPSPGGSKLGGYATWVQDPEVPPCDVCRKPMTFALQLDSGEIGVNFGDIGIGYAFVCPGHGAKFLWQSS
jgi:hypothetical protein